MNLTAAAIDRVDDYYIEEDDESEDDDEPCDYCHGDGGDPYCDGILPCPKCDGEGYKWWTP